MGAEQANINRSSNLYLPEIKDTLNTHKRVRDTQINLTSHQWRWIHNKNISGLAYTRDGRFVIGPDGILSTINGYHVMGESGAINLEEKFPLLDW